MNPFKNCKVNALTEEETNLLLHLLFPIEKKKKEIRKPKQLSIKF